MDTNDLSRLTLMLSNLNKSNKRKRKNLQLLGTNDLESDEDLEEDIIVVFGKDFPYLIC